MAACERSEAGTRRGIARRRSSAGKGTGPGQPAVFDIVLDTFEDGGYRTAVPFAAPIHDPTSLQELRESVRGRGRRGIAALKAKYERNHAGFSADARAAPGADRARAVDRLPLHVRGELPRGRAHGSSGRSRTAGTRSCRRPIRQRLRAVLGIVAMRRGEVENCVECVGASSCIFPIASEAVHRNQAGSREAVKWFTAYLEESPRDLRIIWLLNIVAMTLGEYPDKVPPQYLTPGRAAPPGRRPGPVRECGVARRADRPGPEPGGRQHLRRLQRRRAARPVHHLARRRPRRLALRQPGRRHLRGPVGLGRPGRPGLRAERHAGRLRQRRRPGRPAACAGGGSGRCGSRC